MSRFLMRALLAAVLSLAAAPAFAAPIFVGSFNVYDGPVWTSNPLAVSAKEAAALLFGGSPSDYIISVNASLDPGTITGTAWVDGWADTQYLVTPNDDDFKLSSRLDGGYDQFPSYSAFVCDHAECQAYGNPFTTGTPGLNYTNYVWRVPEPATLSLLGIGLVGLARARRRRS